MGRDCRRIRKSRNHDIDRRFDCGERTIIVRDEGPSLAEIREDGGTTPSARGWRLLQGGGDHREAALLGHVVRRHAHDHEHFDVGTVLDRVRRHPVEMMEI